MEILERLMEWIRLKRRLDSGTHKPPLVSERDIWWISFGKNIGSEINGKSREFSRPGIVFKKLSNGFYLVAPTTSKVHIGSWYVPIEIKDFKTCVCLHQIRTIDHRRMWSKIGTLDIESFTLVKKSFLNLYK